VAATGLVANTSETAESHAAIGFRHDSRLIEMHKNAGLGARWVKVALLPARNGPAFTLERE
jgi:hypothetical protein